MVKINNDEYFLCIGYTLVRIQNTRDYHALHIVPDTQKSQPANITHLHLIPAFYVEVLTGKLSYQIIIPHDYENLDPELG